MAQQQEFNFNTLSKAQKLPMKFIIIIIFSRCFSASENYFMHPVIDSFLI